MTTFSDFSLSASTTPVPAPQQPLNGRIAFYGRTLRDYTEVFGIDPGDLADRRILDVAAGPSSFTLEATLAGAHAVAIDPLYRLTVHGLADRFRRDFAEVRASVAANEGRYDNADERDALFARRREAAERFLGDFVAGRAAGRYRAESLPLLPFEDDQFDLVFCGHFLFLYAHKLDFGFHLDACRELCRVARMEVRVYPLSGFNAEPVPFTETLRAELSRSGIESTLQTLPSPMLHGATKRLILYPKQP